MENEMEYHPLAELFPMMDPDSYAELCADIRQHGLLEPIWTYEGKVLDGRNRYRACLDEGIAPRFLAYEDDDPVAFVVSLNFHRRHLTTSQRAMIAVRLANMKRGRPGENPPIGGFSVPQDKAADTLKVSVRSLQRAAKVQEHCIPEVTKAVDEGSIAVSAAVKLSELPEEQQREVMFNVLSDIVGEGKTEARRIEKAVKVVLGQTANIHVSDDSYEWYTPSEYIEAARELMGEIDLDPASSTVAQETVKAVRFYTREDDGLSKPWSGRVWLNPPYSASLVKAFSQRLEEAYRDGAITEGLILVNNATDTQWFQSLMSQFPVCFTRGRVKFWGPDKEHLATRQGQAVIYFGKREEEFASVFSRFGEVVAKL
jgi:ParB family chromosome partitioning protein